MKIIIVELGHVGDVLTVLQQIDPDFSKVLCLIIGDPGSGKSSLACALGLEEMSPLRKKKFEEACEKIKWLNSQFKVGILDLPEQKHLVYCSGFTINKSSTMQSYDFDPYRIGLKDENFLTQYFEKHSLRIIDEIQSYFNSSQKSLPKRVENNFQKCRHYDIFNIGTAQNGMEIHCRLRRLARFIHVLNTKTISNEAGFISETQWECYYLGKNKNFEMYEESNYSKDYIICKVIFKLKHNIFNYYDSNSCEEEFDDVEYSYSCHFDESVRGSTNAPKGYNKNSESEK